MRQFVPYEEFVIRQLVSAVLEPVVISSVFKDADLVSLEHTGVGYFLTVRHPALPRDRVVCDEPMISGVSNDLHCGFVVFLEDGELTLECHSWGENIPTDIRIRELTITSST